MREAVTFLTLLRQQHNLAYPDTPVYGKDVAAYIGARSKSTVVHYENHHSNPSEEMLSKWLEFWGYGLYIGPLEEEEVNSDPDLPV